MATILIAAVPQRGALPPATFELVTAGQALAQATGLPLAAVVTGANAKALAAELAARGVKTHAVEHPSLGEFVEDLHAKAVAKVAQDLGATRVLAPATVNGRALAARVAVLLKAGLAADCSEILPDGKVRRAYYSGNLVAEVEFKSATGVIVPALMSFPRAVAAGAPAEIVPVAFDPGASKASVAGFAAEQSKEIDLGAAERVVAGGRGLGGPEGFGPVKDLAHAIGAAVGASRAAVDSGWIPYRHQVGLTGRAVRPKLYIAVAISGQIQHLAGMSSSGTIVAINTDKDCPMMQMASIAVQGDYKELIPLVVEEIKKRKGGVPVAA